MPLNRDLISPRSPKPLQSQDGGIQEPRLPPEQEEGSSNDGSIDKTPGSSKRSRLSGLRSRTKAKTMKMLNMDGVAVADGSDSDDDGVFDNIEHNAAFHTSTLVKKKHFRAGKTADKTLSNIKSLGKAVVHPVDSIKSKATRTTAGLLSKAERPFLSQKADQEFLEAHDNLKRVESRSPSRHGRSDEELETIIGGHRDKIREMEAHRESLRAAWTTSRHVRRVRVVPKRHIDFPVDDYFVERDDRGEFQSYDWLKWLGYVRQRL